ncbi:rhodanese-like domain-containing protein [Roseobacteraceae bacterium S113]
MSGHKIPRRAALIGAACLVGSGLTYAQLMPRDLGDTLDAPAALAAIDAGTLVLIDVRRPDEWAATGIARGAVPIDMRRSDFIDAVRATAAARPNAAIGVICARGVRSNRMSRALRAAGFETIVDVPEGMLGSRAGPGWLARNLPTTAYTG